MAQPLDWRTSEDLKWMNKEVPVTPLTLPFFWVWPIHHGANHVNGLDHLFMKNRKTNYSTEVQIKSHSNSVIAVLTNHGG